MIQIIGWSNNSGDCVCIGGKYVSLAFSPMTNYFELDLYSLNPSLVARLNTKVFALTPWC